LKYALIMAGGKGERLWPLSTPERPKQLIPLIDGRTLLDMAVERVEGVAEPVILTNERIANLIGENLRKIVEPVARNTAPALIYATALLQSERGKPVLVAALPSDHHIHPTEVFRDTLERAFNLANEYESIITFGIKPTHPHTGYGYIERGDMLEDGVWKVRKFHEKPDYETAKAYLSSGNYYWNSGMFVWRSDVLLEEARRLAPDIYDLLWEGGRLVPPERFFGNVRAVSIDYAIMEKSDRVIVVEAPFRWTDVGSYSSLYNLLPKDEHGNAHRDAPPLTVDSKGNLVISGGKRVVLVGVEGLAVIVEGDIVLVVPLDKDQKVREAARRFSQGT